MGDQEQGEVGGIAQLYEQLENLGLDDDIEGGGWLVSQQDLRPAGQCHGQAGTLAHTPGELVRVAPSCCPRETNHVEQLVHSVFRTLARSETVKHHGLSDLASDGPGGVQGVHCSLKDHGYVRPPMGLDGLLPPGKDVLAFQEHMAGQASGRREQPWSSPMRPRIALVFPEPDSPTSPMRWPPSNTKLRPLRACNSWWWGSSNQTWRSRTSSSGGGSGAGRMAETVLEATINPTSHHPHITDIDSDAVVRCSQ